MVSRGPVGAQRRFRVAERRLARKHRDACGGRCHRHAPAARTALCEAYPKLSEKFVTLPNGYDREKFADLTASVTPRAADTPLRIVHTGAIYVGRNPLPFLDAVGRLRTGGDTPPLDVRFFGPTPESGVDLTAEAASRRLDDVVTFHGQVSYGLRLARDGRGRRPAADG